VEIHVERDGSTIYVSLRGRLDVLSAEELRAAYGGWGGHQVRDFVVDLAGVEYMDSTGMGALLGLVRRAEEGGGQAYLHSTPPQVQSLFDLTHLHLVLPLYANREQAIARHQRDVQERQ
jgi:anti-anti-sigma factor